jgi:hypothetical protein
MWPGLGLEETMATQIAPDTNGRQDVSRRLFNFLVIGGVCGLAWAAGFRGWMVQLAGSASTFTWGTFIWVLLQGTIIGTLLGWADYRRRTGNTRGRRWLIWSPLLFATAVLGQLEVFLSEGFGGGALAVAILSIGGGYALGGRGHRWIRIVVGVLVALFTIVVGGTIGADMNPELDLSTPRGAWVAVLFLSFMGVFTLACAIPERIGRPLS